MKKKRIFYITETSLPSTSANIINSLKFCNALNKYFKVIFLLPNTKLGYKKISINYNLKNKIALKSLINKKINSKKNKFIFLFKVIKYIKVNLSSGDLILSRSILSSILLAFLNIKNTLEIHHNLSGYSKFLFKILINTNFKKNLSFILIHKNLINDLGISDLNYIVLDDAAEINKKISKKNHLKNTCVYIGSFYQGKGIEIITKLSKIMPNIQFHLYGDFSTLESRKIFISQKNVKLVRRLNYNEVHKVLNKYQIALMPYENKIMSKAQNIEISRYISPLKMFDYLSAGNIIIASKLLVYKHILKNNSNSFVINNKKIHLWKKTINKIFKKPGNYKYIKLNAINTAKMHSWDIRAKKYFNFIKNKDL